MKNMTLLFLVFFTSINAFSKSTDLAQKLIELRAEVQMTADELEAEKKSISSSLQALTIEKGELESRKKLLKAQNTQMQKALIKKKEIVGGGDLKGFEGHLVAIENGVQTLMNYYEDAIPFQKESRLKRLVSLKEQFSKKEITVSEYLEKYWSILQDEIRLVESVEIQNDQVLLGGRTHQVKVLKFGMYQMYFKNFEGRIGYAKKENDGWVFELFDDSDLESGVNLLFLAKEKQIKGGNYNLPIVQHAKIQTLVDQKNEKESEDVL